MRTRWVLLSAAMKQTRLLQIFSAAAVTAILFAINAGAQDTKKDDAAGDTLLAGEFTFKYGKPWERMEVKSSMRAGQLKYDHEGDLQDPEVVFYYFGPGQGGGIKANMDRWIGQFEGEAKSEQKTIEQGGRKIHFLEAKGTYLESSGGPFAGKKTARPDYMLLGAILESPEGAVFLKLFGEEKAVEKLKEDFKKLATSPVGE